MMRRSLLATMGSTIPMWMYYRKESRKFGRWLAQGKLHGPSEDTQAKISELPYMSSQMLLWVFEGVEEVTFRYRKLWGLVAIDQHPDFWKFNHWQVSPEVLDRARQGPQNEQEYLDSIAHWQKFQGFTRIDEYHQIKGEVSLAGGHETKSIETTLQIFRDHLTKPRTLELCDMPEEVLKRGKYCTFVVSSENTSGIYDGLGLKLTYS